jgi:hypothetical protein
MESDALGASDRPRPWLLIALGAAVLALVAFWMWPAGAGTPAVASHQARGQRRGEEQASSSELDVRLERLNAARPEAGTVDRNLFRFQAAPRPAVPAGAGASNRNRSVLRPGLRSRRRLRRFR